MTKLTQLTEWRRAADWINSGWGNMSYREWVEFVRDEQMRFGHTARIKENRKGEVAVFSSSPILSWTKYSQRRKACSR